MRNIRVAAVQFQHAPGDKSANLATIERFVASAAAQKVEIITFPECGISGYWQFGINDSRTMLADKYFGLGLTGFGLVPARPADSIGTGLAWSWLNHPPGSGRRSQEVMLAFYYQLHIIGGIFFQPTLTYLPEPGASINTPGAAALTLQMTVLF